MGAANDFFGWLAITRIKNMNDIWLTPDPTFDSRPIKVENKVFDM
jgi:hypothetical protein